MPANTPKGYPYPLGTDRLMDGDDSIHNLATAVDTNLGVAASGIVTSPPFPGVADGTCSIAVTFPVGRFTAVPVVTVTAVGSGPFMTSVLSTTTAGVTLYAARRNTSTSTAPLQWLAVQV